MDKYIKEIEVNSHNTQKVKELSKEAVRKFQMAENYEVLVDSTLDKQQSKTVLRYKRENSKRSFHQQTVGSVDRSSTYNNADNHLKDSFHSLTNMLNLN